MNIDAVNQILQDNIRKDQRVTGDAVFGLIDYERNTLPERVFVNYFLPKFMGDNPTGSNWVVEWISIAGSPSSEVSITGENGEILFNVPPLLYTQGLNLHGNGPLLHDIVTRYIMISNNLPQEGIRFLYNHMDGKNRELFEAFDISPVEARWMEIIERYNLTEGGSSPSASSVTNNTSDDLTDMFDFD